MKPNRILPCYRPGRWQGWVDRVNQPLTKQELAGCQLSAQRGKPFGDESWGESIARRLNLESTMRPRGRKRVRFPEDQNKEDRGRNGCCQPCPIALCHQWYDQYCLPHVRTSSAHERDARVESILGSSMPGLRFLLPMLHPRCHHLQRTGRGQSEWLVLLCRTLSFPIPNRFNPALSLTPLISAPLISL